MALQTTTHLNVDFYDKKYILINAKQYDKNSRFLSITCYNHGKIFPINSGEHSAYIRYKKPDSHSVFNFCEINRKGEILVELTEQMLVSSGICYADLVIVNKGDANVNADTGEIVAIDNASILSTMVFCIDASESAVENTEIESSYEYNGLNTALEKAEAEYKEVIQLAKSYAVGNADGIRENENYDNAKYYYEQSLNSANKAKLSEDAAFNSEKNARTYMNNAETYMNNASISEDNAEIYMNTTNEYMNATNEYMNTTKAYIDDAKISEANAKTSEINALDSANKAKSSEDASKISEQNALASEQNAKTYMDNTETYKNDAYAYMVDAEIYKNDAKDSKDASSLSESNAKISEQNAKISEQNALASEQNAKTCMDNAKISETNASISEQNAKSSEDNALDSANKAQSYAVGGTGTRNGEDIDNAQYYYEMVKTVANGLNSGFIPMGTISFSELATAEKATGFSYNINDNFTTDDTFREGSGKLYTAGTNVYYTADGYWDCFGGTVSPMATVDEVKNYLGI